MLCPSLQFQDLYLTLFVYSFNSLAHSYLPEYSYILGKNMFIHLPFLRQFVTQIVTRMQIVYHKKRRSHQTRRETLTLVVTLNPRFYFLSKLHHQVRSEIHTLMEISPFSLQWILTIEMEIIHILTVRVHQSVNGEIFPSRCGFHS